MAEQHWTSVITGDKRNKTSLKEIIKNKDLIFLWVRRDFVSKYKQTILGPAWAVIQPFFTTVVYSVFFGDIAGLGAAGVPNFIFYLAGTILWSLFSGSLTANASTFTTNSTIFSKVYFPRLVMPVASAISQFIAFAIQFGFMIIFLIYYVIVGENVHPNMFMLMTPLLMVQMAGLGMGFGMIISSLTTKYKDLNMVVGFGVSLWSYCSPVAYDMFSRNILMPGRFAYYIYMCNPTTPIINVFRYAFLGTGEIDWLYYAISWVVTVLVILLGARMFNKVERTFIDTI